MAKKEDPNIEIITDALEKGAQLYKAFQYGQEIIKEVRELVILRDSLEGDVSKKKEAADREISEIESDLVLKKAELEKTKADVKASTKKALDENEKRLIKSKEDHDGIIEQYRLQIEVAQNTLDNLNKGIDEARSTLASTSEQVSEVEKQRAILFAALAG